VIVGRSRRAGSGERWPTVTVAAVVSCTAAIGLLVALIGADHDSRLVFGTDTKSAAASAHPSAATDGARLFVDPILLGKLQTLADGLNKEIVLCLTGNVTDGVGHATDFVMPSVHTSTPTSSSVDACPDQTVAVWHNHTLIGTALARLARDWNGTSGQPRAPGLAAALCRLSERDIATLVNSDYPFSVISVDRDTWCWWTRPQVVEFARANELTGHPIAGQIRTQR